MALHGAVVWRVPDSLRRVVTGLKTKVCAQVGALLILGRMAPCGTCWLLGHDINSDSHHQ